MTSGAAPPGAISGVAHEFRTPIAAIRGAAAALRRADLDDPVRERLLSVIDAAAAQLARLADDLLVAGAGGIADLPMQLEPLDAATVALGVVAAAEVAAPGRAKPAVRAPTPGPLVVADEVRLHQALGALVDNAIAYGPPGVEIQIAVESAGERVRIVVTDTGPGIPAEEHERVFEPFVRLARSGPGSGLGLHVARELVRAMGGELALSRSAPGLGSTFTIELPSA